MAGRARNNLPDEMKLASRAPVNPVLGELASHYEIMHSAHTLKTWPICIHCWN